MDWIRSWKVDRTGVCQWTEEPQIEDADLLEMYKNPLVASLVCQHAIMGVKVGRA